jgi:hypothetical protein
MRNQVQQFQQYLPQFTFLDTEAEDFNFDFAAVKTDFFSEKAATTTNASEEGAILFINLYKNLHEYYLKNKVCFIGILILQIV